MILQVQSHALRPLTTAHLAQTMTLLELSGAELQQKIEAELSSNPALELHDEHRCPICGRKIARPGPCPLCSLKSSGDAGEPIIFVSPYSDIRAYDLSDQPDETYLDSWNAAPEDLSQFVLRQIAPELEIEDRSLAAHLLTSLDEDGLLRVPLIEFVRFHHVSLSRVEQVLSLIQRAEPVGVGCASPQDALLIQLEVLAETRPVPPLAEKAIREGMDLLSRKAYNELARKLGVSTREAQQLAGFIIDNLNPYPARAHWGDVYSGAAAPQGYLNPDILISLLNDDKAATLVVEILAPYAGCLRVNPLFKEALQQETQASIPDNEAAVQKPSTITEQQNDLPVETSSDRSDDPERLEKWNGHLEKAGLLVKCLQQRNHTMVRLMQCLVRIQREFILHGDAHLNPLTRAQIAVELDLHESTVSRAVTGKAVQLPNNRIIPLDKFFDRSLQVRTALREIIAQETQPLSDTQLAEVLMNQGYPVARRTVAKYRSMEGILPARFRQPALFQVPA